ncbi:MAG: hypothetical protein ABDH59_08530 [Fervidobacterium sp.]
MAYSSNPKDVLSIATSTLNRLGDLSKVRIGIGAMNMRKDRSKIVEVARSLEALKPNEIIIFSFEDVMIEDVKKSVVIVSGVNLFQNAQNVQINSSILTSESSSTIFSTSEGVLPPIQPSSF